LKKYAVQFWRDESGQDLVEYALLLAVIAVAGVVGLSTLAGTISQVWTNVNAQLVSTS
jgi:Flp pilus assembly pilin Flp